VSVSSCNDLGWTNAPSGWNPRVCAASNAAPLTGCSGEVHWRTALHFCEDVGARLCSVDELQQNEARNTGCSYDSAWVWTSTPCLNGKLLSIGSNKAGTDTVCGDSTRTAAVRCCADVSTPTAAPTLSPTVTVLPIAVSVSTCDDLGWNPEENGSPAVCAVSDAAPLAGCSGAIRWRDALRFCEGVGARLCSADELQQNEARGTGCSYDLAWVWTSTPCPDGYLVTTGSSKVGTETICEPFTHEAVVRCCADVEAPSPSPTTLTPMPSSINTKLNVLFISVDDLRWLNTKDGSHRPVLDTPGFDSLARGSLLLRNAHVPATICTASRGSILTGRRLDTTQLYSYQRSLHVEDGACKTCLTIPLLFKEAGYYTTGVGKIYHLWHEKNGKVRSCPLFVPLILPSHFVQCYRRTRPFQM